MALGRFGRRREEEPPDDGRPGRDTDGEPPVAGAEPPPTRDEQLGTEVQPAAKAQPELGADLIDALARGREKLMNGELSSDEYRRRVTALLRDASPEEVAAASAGLSSTSEFSHVRASAEAGGFAPARGAAPMSVARTAAIERLTELRAAGKIDEESFLREKERLSSYGG